MLIQLPAQDNTNGVFSLETHGQPVVLIGANGSGKSRMGYFVEQNNQSGRQVVRIPAHRALTIPVTATMLSVEQAENALRYGHSTESNLYYKYRNEPPTVYLQNDYEHLLSVIFAQENRRNAEYISMSKSNTTGIQAAIPESVIDIIIRVWKDILPQREIAFTDNKVTAQVLGNTYHGKEMSDGEQVALYLVAYCLSAPRESIVIVDEPELHLHKSLMSNLWSQVEAARSDCQFIYITHDLEFASSRTKAAKIWVKTFSNASTWTWQFVPEVEEIPEELILEIIGSRKPILFVEGEKGSYDYEIFQYIFPQFTVLPRSGGAKVIESTKSLKNNASLHTIEAWGIVDRDYKNEPEIASLQRNNVRVCDVAEIENLLLTPELIEVIAKNQGYIDATEFVTATTDFVIGQLQREFDKEVSYTTSLEINYRLNAFDKKQRGLTAIKQTFNDLSTSIDVDAIYEHHRARYQSILDTRDLKAALRHYTNKGLLPNMSNILRLKAGEYERMILRLLKTDKKAEIVAALQQYIPVITPTRQLATVGATA